MDELPADLIDGILSYLRYREQRPCFQASQTFHVWSATRIKDTVVEEFLARPLTSSMADGYFDPILADLSDLELIQLMKTGIDWDGKRLFESHYRRGCARQYSCDWLSCGSCPHLQVMKRHRVMYQCDVCEGKFCECTVSRNVCRHCRLIVCRKCERKKSFIAYYFDLGHCCHHCYREITLNKKEPRPRDDATHKTCRYCYNTYEVWKRPKLPSEMRTILFKNWHELCKKCCVRDMIKCDGCRKYYFYTYHKGTKRFCQNCVRF